MNYRIFLIIAGVLCALLLSAGCTQTPATPPATTVATTAPTAVPTTAPPTQVTTVTTPKPTVIEPGVVATLPPEYMVEVSVDRNVVAIDPKITTTFRGGKGINFVTAMDVTVTRSDGTTETKQIIRPKVNDQVVIMGTTSSDRVVVKVTTADGKNYTIFDQMMPFRQYS